MACSKKAASPPEFLNTHPSDETKIKDMKKFLPEALRFYKQRERSE